jgi:N-acyl homoserine lactone hydrolase
VAGTLELYLFDSGTLALSGVEVPVPFFLLRHPSGNVLVDGGNPLSVARDPHAHWGPLADAFTVQMSEDQHCAAQLRQLGLDDGDISHIVQTHLHIDHTGALGHFPRSSVVVHERELDAARQAGEPLESGYVKADYERPELRWETFAGERDLFGDGTIRLLETPGHCAGHVSLLISLAETGAVLITADAVDNRAQWEGRQRLRALHSREQAARSLERLRGLADELDPLIVFGHDAQNWAQLRRAPQGYR